MNDIGSIVAPAAAAKGKGIKTPVRILPGDQLVTVRIVLPETIDDSLAYFFSEWRQKNSYDPGRK